MKKGRAKLLLSRGLQFLRLGESLAIPYLSFFFFFDQYFS
jgi:hypothetical protein